MTQRLGEGYHWNGIPQPFYNLAQVSTARELPGRNFKKPLVSTHSVDFLRKCTEKGKETYASVWQYNEQLRKKVSRQRRHAVKNPGEVRARPCGTKNRLADRKQCALSTQPNPHLPAERTALICCRQPHQSRKRTRQGQTVDLLSERGPKKIKRSAFDRLGDLVPQVRARTSPGFFMAWRS